MHRLVAALERDHLSGRPGPELEQLRGEREDRRCAAVVGLVRIGLRPGDEFSHGRGRMLGVDDHDHRVARHHGDRDEMLERLIGNFRIDGGTDRHLAGRGEQQRVAVGRRFRRDIGTEHAVRARPVLDDEALAERFLQPLRNQAPEDVGTAARGIAHDDLHGAGRIGAGSAPAGAEASSATTSAGVTASFSITISDSCSRGRNFLAISMPVRRATMTLAAGRKRANGAQRHDHQSPQSLDGPVRRARRAARRARRNRDRRRRTCGDRAGQGRARVHRRPAGRDLSLHAGARPAARLDARDPPGGGRIPAARDRRASRSSAA